VPGGRYARRAGAGKAKKLLVTSTDAVPAERQGASGDVVPTLPATGPTSRPRHRTTPRREGRQSPVRVIAVVVFSGAGLRQVSPTRTLKPPFAWSDVMAHGRRLKLLVRRC
jgi:hypothetical protein